MDDGPTSASTPAPGYSAEVRFAVVMYGGVSLAIYINGVANEMYEMAHATPRAGPLPAPLGAGTREIYRRLCWLCNDPALVGRYAWWLQGARDTPDPLDQAQPGALPTRLVVDVIAGTSAGGINGLFLGKALANNEPFAPLRELWVREGDIAGLLNDERSYRDADMQARGLRRPPGKPQSLLNSDRMYCKLSVAMQAMSAAAAQPPVLSSCVDELDLFVTTTDIRGSLVKLRLFDKVVHEKRHRQVFGLRYRDDGRQAVVNDLVATNNPFLAFVARCTSSFPFAFEPMTLKALGRLEPALKGSALRDWDRFFTGVPPDELSAGAHLTRAFGDGGYLDNKPFTHAVAALSLRTAGVPVERKLVYVEPAPAHPEREPEAAAQAPDALANALAALTSIPSYETIREDLEAVLRRNRRIERIDRIVRLGEIDLDVTEDDPLARVLLELCPDDSACRPQWRELSMRQLRHFYGDAFLPYVRLRHYTVTDELADRLARLWDLPADTDQVYALRAMVRAWREARYRDKPGSDEDALWIGPLNAFLDDYDLGYRVRRMAFLLRKLDQLSRLLTKRRFGRLEALNEADVALAARLRSQAGLDIHGADLAGAALEQALLALQTLKQDLVAAHLALRSPAPLEVDTPALATHRAALRPELLRVLALLLLEQGADLGPELRTTDGSSLRVQFPEEQLKLPSASRTLQEGIFMRAKTLLNLAQAGRRTALQQLLEDDLGRMGDWLQALVKCRPDVAPPPGAQIWLRLGQPQPALADTGTGGKFVYVEVGDTGEPALDTPVARQLRRFLGNYYLRFDSYDQMSFPLYYDTESGEPSTVEVVRVSPEDAPALIDERHDPRRKLAGTALANFGAFLQLHWRSNDIMWGRLDGAERLITTLLPGLDEPSARVREQLVGEAHRSILREALRPDGHRQITGLLCEALSEVSRGLPAASRGQDALLRLLLARLAPDTPAAQRRLQQLLASLLQEDELLDWVRRERDVDRRLDPESTLNSAARAVTITGDLLQGVAARRDLDLPVLRWVARAGVAGQGLLAVSLPGSLGGLWTAHLIKVLYAFELTMLALGLLFGSESMRTAAVTALGVTVTLQLAMLLIGDVLRSSRSWRAKSAWALGIPLLLLAVLGVLALARVGWKTLLGLA